MLEGILNVAKPYGWTSHDVVAVVRRLARMKRVGHAGTLDPAATGVLVVALGRATRLLDYMAGRDKCYCGDVVLGAATDTDDAQGTVLYSRDPSSVSLSQLTAALSTLMGEIDQVPPQYSAVKLEGRKAYDLARRGERANVAPRRVTVRGMALVDWAPPKASILVRCSKGTYIRSLARDLGERLETGAYLDSLVRLTAGHFSCADSVGIEELRMAAEFGYLDQLVWPPDVAVSHLPALLVSEEHASGMVGGRSWPVLEDGAPNGPVRVYADKGNFLGLAERSDGVWQPRLVMSEVD